MKNFEKIVSLCKNRGFIFHNSEIYGGLSNAWDYGPLGVELKNNLKKIWWKKFIHEPKYNVGIDSAILMNPGVWVASGHVGNFSDPLIDCKVCRCRFRADKLIEEAGLEFKFDLSFPEMSDLIAREKIKCPNCGNCDFTSVRSFNLMFKTFQGVVEGEKNEIYLRPETAQGIFVNFSNVQRVMRKKLPFGIGQIGKSFRNEITTGNFIFRTREFEQMELEFFYNPSDETDWFNYWKEFSMNFFLDLGISKESIRFRDHEKDELSHYSSRTTDVEFNFSFGWGELCGVADRGNFDLSCHQNKSGKSLEYFDSLSNRKFLPSCIEPSFGVDRVILALLYDAFEEEFLESTNETRTVLKLSPALAPIKVCVLPLTKKLTNEAVAIYEQLAKFFVVDFDDSGSIGKRYRRQDEIGTPFCVTFDFDSLSDRCVTVRHRDSMMHEPNRISIENLVTFINERI